MINLSLRHLVAAAAIAAVTVSQGEAALLRPRDCVFAAAADSGDTCKSMAEAWFITESQFISYNPGVNCASLAAGREYCVEWTGKLPSVTTTTSTTTAKATTSTTTTPPPTTASTRSTTTTKTTSTAPSGPSPTQDGIVKNCKQYHLAVTGDTCGIIVSKYGSLSLENFYKWNPAVGSSCASLWLGYYYCVAVDGVTTTKPVTTTPKPVTTTTTTPAPSGPTPVQDGIAKDCQRWHKVKSGDGCQKIVDTYQTFTLSQFYSWNPAVGTACSSLFLDYYVCIGVKGTPTQPPPTTTTKTTQGPSKPTVTPTQPNVNPKCTKWHLVSTGDFCQKIADTFKITLANFYKWNPDVGTSCASLFLGYYVCVGA